MKHQTTKTLFAFIITMVIFFVIPQVSNAQGSGTKSRHFCPPCYKWYKGDCVPCRSCCTWSFALPPNESSSVSLSESSAINFQLLDKGPVSIKIYDMTGRVVKTIADGKMPEDYEVKWDNKDDSGKAAPAGVYFLRIVTGNYTETKKMLIVK